MIDLPAGQMSPELRNRHARWHIQITRQWIVLLLFNFRMNVVGGKRTNSEQNERGTRAPKKFTGYPSLSHRLLSCCSFVCSNPVPGHKVVLYAILQSILLLPKSAAKPVPQAASDCHSVCKILHSNTLDSNRPDGNYGNSLDTYKHCVLGCCVKEEIDNLIRMKNGAITIDDFLGDKRETYDDNLKENENVLFTRIPSSLTTFKRETPTTTTRNGYKRFYRFPFRSDDGITKREVPPNDKQNENRLFPFAISGKCAQFVSVQYEHQVDKMSVVIPDAASPQKRRWGSAIGSCINAHCSELSGSIRAECIMAKCHRSRRSNDLDATEDEENILMTTWFRLHIW